MVEGGKQARFPRLSNSRKALKALISSYQIYRQVEWIQTGVRSIDLAVGNGIPRGRFLEVIGEPSAFKSSFGYLAAAAFQREGGVAALLDTEAKTDKKFVIANGVNWNDLIYLNPDSIEKVISTLEALRAAIRKIDPVCPILIIWDSIAGTPSIEELDEENVRKSEMAVRARLISAGLRRDIIENAKQDITLIAMNHIKAKIGVMFGAKTDSPGGKAVKYHSSVRITFRSKGRIKNANDKVIGQFGAFTVVKNNVGPPFREAEIKFLYESGFDPYWGLTELFEREGRVKLDTKSGKAGWYRYKHIKFRPKDLPMIIEKNPELLIPLDQVLPLAESPLDEEETTEVVESD